MKFKMVCLGGTFDQLHRGHKKLIDRAFSLGDRVLIGITSDGFKTDHEVDPYKVRYRGLANYLGEKGFLSRARIEEIKDPYSSAMLAEIEAIVVSEETRESAERLNEMRMSRSLRPLKIVQISWVRAEDGSILSSTAIRKGIVDREGKLLQKG
jgi:pantetheine-phosphate adenylyltransferase